MLLALYCNCQTPLASRHGFGNNSLKSELLFLQVIGTGIFDLKLSHGIAESRLNLLLGTTLELDRHSRVGNNLFDTRNIGFELLPSLETFAISFIAAVELLGI